MPEFITIKSGKKKIRLNLDHIAMCEYEITENGQPILMLADKFAATREEVVTFKGQEANDIDSYLDALGLEVPKSRRKITPNSE